MILSDLSIRRPVFAWMLMASLIVFGAIAVSRLGVSEQPDVDFPVLTINVKWTGAAPEIMETEIVDRLEEVIVSTQGLRDIVSSIRQGEAAITLEFDLSRNVDAALTEVQSKISAVQLPIGVQAPTITKTNPEDQPILLLAVTGKKSLHELTEYVEVTLADQFKILPGVGEVVFSGYSKRNLRVWADNEKLKKLQLNVLDLKTALEQEHVEVAAGYIENPQKEINIRTMGEGLTAEMVAKIPVKRRGGEPIYNSKITIGDVARVEDGLDDIRRLAVVSNGAGLGLGIKKQRGANAVSVARAVKNKLVELKKTLPPDIKIEVNFDSTKFIEEAIHETLFTLALSALVTGAVCYLFLGSWSTTLNVLLAIPTSVMGTFLVMYFMGFTLNFFTLLGLSLAIGIVVDDAIMVLENIVRHSEMGKDRVSAARDGAREIFFAALAATVSVMAIFLPVAFMHGIIGKYFFQFGITISAAVSLSLLEALTITPMRCAEFMDRADGRGLGWLNHITKAIFSRLAQVYRRVLELALRQRFLVLAGAAGLFALSLLAGELLRKEFVPAQDQGVFLVRLETPVGSSLEFTKDKLLEVEKILRAEPNIARFFIAIGGFTQSSGAPEGAVTDDAVNSATVYVTLKEAKERRVRQQVVMRELREKLSRIPDLRAIPQDLSTRGFTAQRGFPIEVNLRGPDYKKLQEKADEIVCRLEKTGYVTDLDTDLRSGMPEVRVWPKRDAAAASGVTVDALAQTVSTAIGGAVQGKFTNGNRRYDVRLRLEGGERVSAEDINKLQVRTAFNELIPITDVARIETVSTYQTLSRHLRERSVSIFANVAEGKSQAAALDQVEKTARLSLPDGYRLYLGGGAATFRETFDSLLFALVLGIVIAYMVLASQFNSYLHPLVVLLALPFSVSGAFAALLLTGQTLNLYSMIGLVLLMGIVKKNSILLVEFTNRKREEGLPLHEAILAAGPVRLRPILMTCLSTVAAALPPALALGPGAESRIPLAVAVLGGVIVSTLMTLVVVPCAYSAMARLERVKKQEAPHAPMGYEQKLAEQAAG